MILVIAMLMAFPKVHLQGSIKKHDYDITFETGPQEDAGTYSYVKIRMFNEKGEHSLIHVDRQEFEVGRSKHKAVLYHLSDGSLFCQNRTPPVAASAAPIFKATTINFKVDICQSGVPPFLRSCTFPVEKWLKNGNDTTHGIEVQKQEKRDCGNTFVANITTERAEPNSWPWQAQIKILTNNRPHHCSGVLIQRQWVLTAAACFDNNKKKNAYRVMLGDHDLTRKEYTEQEFQIDDLIIHPNHTSKYSMYNIALLKLRQPVIINRKVKIICLPDDDADIPVVSKLESSCYSTGWEDRPTNEGPPNILKQTGFLKSSMKYCEKYIEKINQKEKNISKLRNEFLCMKHQREPFCHDDTGGPLVCANLFNKYILYGLDIFEKQNCRNPSHYTLFVNIANHLDWIEGNVYTKYIDPTELLPKFP